MVGGSAAKRVETTQSRADDYSDDDYEEGFEDNADGGAEDEMERIRKAMEYEKKKAKKFQER